MKNKHELPNGTVLEIGKRYVSEKWEGYIEVNYLGKDNLVLMTGDDGNTTSENTSSYRHANDIWNLQPYTEPKKKIKVAKYAFFNSGDWKWKESKEFYKSDEEFEETTGRRTYIRLTHTEIEVDEY